MSEKENNVPVGEENVAKEAVEKSPSESREEKEYYLRLLRMMCPTLSADHSDRVMLTILQKRVGRLVEMLKLFEHSRANEIPVMQRACMQYMATESLSGKERQKMIEVWTSCTTFYFESSRYRGLLTRFLQYHHRMLQDIECFLKQKEDESFPETLDAS